MPRKSGNYMLFSANSLEHPNGGYQLIIRYLMTRDGSNEDASSSMTSLQSVIIEFNNDVSQARIEVMCGNLTWNLCKSIICPLSGFLNGVCDPNSKESRDGKIVLHDIEPEVFARFANYMQTGRNYDPCVKDGERLESVIQLHKLALYLDAPALDAIAIESAKVTLFTGPTRFAREVRNKFDLLQQFFSQSEAGDSLRLALMTGTMTMKPSLWESEYLTHVFQKFEPTVWKALSDQAGRKSATAKSAKST